MQAVCNASIELTTFEVDELVMSVSCAKVVPG